MFAWQSRARRALKEGVGQRPPAWCGGTTTPTQDPRCSVDVYRTSGTFRPFPRSLAGVGRTGSGLRHEGASNPVERRESAGLSRASRLRRAARVLPVPGLVEDVGNCTPERTVMVVAREGFERGAQVTEHRDSPVRFAVDE